MRFGKSLEHDEVETKVVPRRLVLGMEREALLVGVQASLEGFRPQAVVEALDVIAFTAREPVGAFQRTLGVLVALVEEGQIVVHDRELGERHREAGIDLDSFLEERCGFRGKTALVIVHAFSVVAVGLDGRGGDLGEAAIVAGHRRLAGTRQQ